MTKFEKLITQADAIMDKAKETGFILDWQEVHTPLKKLNRCQKLTMAQMDMVIERNWTAVLGERAALGL